MKYLVIGTSGPGFSSPEEEISLLEEVILPTFDQLIKMEKKKVILGGGLPLGERAFVFIMDASSNEEVDQILRKLPLWGMLDWEVTALQTFSGRADQERDIVAGLKKKK